MLAAPRKHAGLVIDPCANLVCQRVTSSFVGSVSPIVDLLIC